jgi:type IV secretion system protein VirB6
MTITVFTEFDVKVNTLVQTFTVELMQNIITNITPLVLLGMTIYFCMYGFMILNGSVGDSFNDLVKQFFRIGLIASIALAGGMYQSHLADIVINLPSDFAKLVLNQPSDTLSVADQMMSLGFKEAGKIASSMNIVQPADSIIKAFVALIVAFCSVFLGGIGGGLMIVMKMECAIVAAVGPLFIIALLFPAVRQLFSNWFGIIISYAIFSLLLTAIFVFILKIAKTYITAIEQSANVFASTFSLMAFTIIGLFMLKSAKNLAEKLSGVLDGMGVSGQAFNASAKMVSYAAGNATKNLGRDAGKLAGGAARGIGKAGGKGLDKMAAASWRRKSNK